MDNLIDLKKDGSFRMNLDFFGFLDGLTMTNERFNRLFDGPPRKPETDITEREMDIARSIQIVTEEIVLRMARYAHYLTKSENLCLSGGVALNCVSNGRLLQEGPFKNIWIQPAAGDAGGALGAALMVWHTVRNEERKTINKNDKMKGAYLGPAFNDEEIGLYLEEKDYPAHRFKNEDEWSNRIAQLIYEQNVIGLFQGRMEFGPRALGNRSIIGDARSPNMQSIMNLKIKHRESFRPFAPSCLEERVSDFFELDRESPYMLLVTKVRSDRCKDMDKTKKGHSALDRINQVRSDIPAITHVDYSARVQTVSLERNPGYYKIIKNFEELSGCGIIINTSFNVRGEPIVCSPEDAYRCFMRTDMDYLVLGSYILDKREQPEWIEKIDWRKAYVLD